MNWTELFSRSRAELSMLRLVVATLFAAVLLLAVLSCVPGATPTPSISSSPVLDLPATGAYPKPGDPGYVVPTPFTAPPGKDIPYP